MNFFGCVGHANHAYYCMLFSSRVAVNVRVNFVSGTLVVMHTHLSTFRRFQIEIIT